MKNKINRQLLPNIKFLDNEDRILEYSDKDTPLEQAIKNADKSLFLTAMGGQGKTTTLRTLWLDFLCGKNDIPCLYIDCKLLDEREHDNAIHTFIKNKYGVDIAEGKFDRKPIILLDGANEADAHLRQNDTESNLVKESKRLIIHSKFRLVISGRSSYISERAEEDGSHKVNEFDESIMHYCELCELTDRQLVKALGKGIEDSPLCKLLKNNMMLSIYMELNPYGEKIDKNITAGKLLEKYFNDCFRTRYIQNALKFDGDEKTLFEKIKNVEEELVQNPIRRLHNITEREISEKILDFEEIYNYLMDNSSQQNFTVTDLSSQMYLPVLEHLSILQKNNKDEYVWANEVYNDYFLTKKICSSLEKIEKKNDFICFKSPVLYYMFLCSHLREFKFYTIVQYVGDIIKGSKIEINKIYKLFIENAVYINELIGKYDWQIIRRILLTLFLLINNSLPEGLTCVDEFEFSNCYFLSSVKIPRDIRLIAKQAFFKCENLKKVELTNVESIGDGAFAFCNNLLEINIPKSVQKIDLSAFAGCENLESIKFEDAVDWFIICEKNKTRVNKEDLLNPLNAAHTLRALAFSASFLKNEYVLIKGKDNE